jgi:hypothetical protein
MEQQCSAAVQPSAAIFLDGAPEMHDGAGCGMGAECSLAGRGRRGVLMG